MEKLSLAEHFISINGEGRRAGELSLFLRFTGCDLRCDWCDTMWANEKDAPHRLLAAEELTELAAQAIAEFGIRNVTLTGGEPLLQRSLPQLCAGLCALGLHVEIETNGSAPVRPFLEECQGLGVRPQLTMDYKLPSSNMESRMCMENFRFLRPDDTLKLVCASRQDLERAAQLIRELAPECQVYLSPVFGRIDPAEMVEFLKEKKLGSVRLQLQLHKIIWDPERRGV
ncbi:MAG: putative 7-carboxy-7-deazaguanine synthase QueE [Ruminococcus sp.]|nr:putative 7-carboxy-7-deazaguanine synthase QueE [Ruminococcus sp.]